MKHLHINGSNALIKDIAEKKLLAIAGIILPESNNNTTSNYYGNYPNINTTNNNYLNNANNYNNHQNPYQYLINGNNPTSASKSSNRLFPNDH